MASEGFYTAHIFMAFSCVNFPCSYYPTVHIFIPVTDSTVNSLPNIEGAYKISSSKYLANDVRLEWCVCVCVCVCVWGYKRKLKTNSNKGSVGYLSILPQVCQTKISIFVVFM